MGRYLNTEIKSVIIWDNAELQDVLGAPVCCGMRISVAVDLVAVYLVARMQSQSTCMYSTIVTPVLCSAVTVPLSCSVLCQLSGVVVVSVDVTRSIGTYSSARTCTGGSRALSLSARTLAVHVRT